MPSDFTPDVDLSYTPFAAFHEEILPEASPLRAAITAAYRRDEIEMVRWLHAQADPDAASHEDIRTLARKLVQTVREKRTRASGVDALMHEFSLSSQEGVALMCLAEALLRIPDHETADRLIADKISKGDWRRHLGESPSLFVNAATWGLLITGKLIGTSSEQGLGAALTNLISKGGEILIRKGVDLAMRMLGSQFVTGRTIEEALVHSKANEARGYRYSYDMLGEAALTEPDAARYEAAYEEAIHAIGRASAGRGIRNGPGISVKLSALHPRYARAQRQRVMRELLPRLKKLMLLARHYDIGLNIDAEESDRLELSLDLLEALAFDTELSGFDGIGLVVQAYQKRCPFIIDYLVDLAHRSGRKLMVRLVKGAYWDTEIKRAQFDGLAGYPVFTRKVYTDVCYLVCAQKLLAATDVIYPQFATHNAYTLAAVHTWAQQRGITDYEFQCLHGMGETLYDQIVGKHGLDRPCRIYAPVGSHETLLAYLVRRLLENGANSSFVNQIVDEHIPIDALIENPFEKSGRFGGQPHPRIPLPSDLFGTERKNSAGLDLSDENTLRELDAALSHWAGQGRWQASPLLQGAVDAHQLQPVLNPAHRRDLVGQVIEANASDVQTALAAAAAHAMDWQAVPPAERAGRLMRAADLLEANRVELIALAIREAGKSFPNAIGEVREAVDFLRYYAAQVSNLPNTPALGPVVCISPWNFPLAIFIGQVGASLAAGNVVLAKPAEQTPLIACRAVQLLHDAGIPRAAVQLLPGRGETVGAALVADARVRGVLFTGSNDVAMMLHRTLAMRAATEHCDIPLIAETGGQNAMIVDSSALPEQVVQDVIASAFDSAGQRCSALRVLYLQQEIADKTLRMLKAAMQQLAIGNPDRLAIDIGPIIDAEAQRNLSAHLERMKGRVKDLFQLPLSTLHQSGTYVAPALLEIESLSELTREVFGPVLHVIRYHRNHLPQVIDAINNTGYGLTLGIHSRIDETINFIIARAHVGNVYVNRNIVGAVVGEQPFGGEGKSGTGPKAGGPLYLKRLQRQPDVTPASLAVHFDKPSQTEAALHSLAAWATGHGYAHVATLARHYALDTLLDGTLTLPGPTGERNTLSFAARGSVFCAAATLGGFLNQLAAVIATGNIAIIEKNTSAIVPEHLPPSVGGRIRRVDSIAAAVADVRIALVDTLLASAQRIALSQDTNILIPIVETVEKEAIPLWRLLVERTVCVNTTAAGGNASLMTLKD